MLYQPLERIPTFSQDILTILTVIIAVITIIMYLDIIIDRSGTRVGGSRGTRVSEFKNFFRMNSQFFFLPQVLHKKIAS